MAQNITLMGASYSAVPAVTLPKTGGGTASFTDVSDTTATAADVASGTYFYTAAGEYTEGTASGGGGGGSAVFWKIAKNGSGSGSMSVVFEEQMLMGDPIVPDGDPVAIVILLNGSGVAVNANYPVLASASFVTSHSFDPMGEDYPQDEHCVVALDTSGKLAGNYNTAAWTHSYDSSTHTLSVRLKNSVIFASGKIYQFIALFA